MTFTVTVKNRGSSQADSSTVAYYIDDTYLAFATVKPIDPGATDNNSFTWTAQTGPPTIKGLVCPYNKPP